MERVYTRINWENEPSILTPLNATNLNKIDSAVYTIDGRVVGFDTTKANQSDLLECVKQIDYDTTTGVFTFTWQNGTTQSVDLNIEKIPVSFSMDSNGVITMTTSDGTQYTANVGALIKTYAFQDSSIIDFTVTTDASGNKTVTADIVAGSIDGTKLVPNYLADCQSARTEAQSAATSADSNMDAAEAWANGTIDGEPVPSTHPAYHNNAKFWSDHSQGGGVWGAIIGDIDDQTDLATKLNAKQGKPEVIQVSIGISDTFTTIAVSSLSTNSRVDIYTSIPINYTDIETQNQNVRIYWPSHTRAFVCRLVCWN